jgi:lysine-specific demethylase/histidyl-hydroxylase NO66
MISLEELLFPVTPADFRQGVLGRRPLHVPAVEGQARRSLLTWDAFNGLLNQPGIWTAETLRLLQDRKAIPAEAYCRLQPTPNGPVRRPSQDKVQLHVAAGASIVANEVQGLHAPVAEAAQVLSAAFAAEVGANVYCSFKGVQAFGPHFDNHDVFAVQTQGTKRWRIYQGQLDMPVDLPPDGPDTRQWLERSHGPLAQEIVMQPGDLLYLPRGRFHEAIAEDDASLHVTFSVTAMFGRSLFGLLENAAMQFPEFRRYLPPAWEEGGRPLSVHLAKLGNMLAELAVSPAFLQEVAMAQQRLTPRLSRSTLPVRLKPTRYNVTGSVFPSAGPNAAVAYDWCRSRPSFDLEDLLAEIDFVAPAELRLAVERAEKAGAIRRVTT